MRLRAVRCLVWLLAVIVGLAGLPAFAAGAGDDLKAFLADDLVIEEVLVKAVDRCGPWPIAHESILDCIYPELKRDQLRALRELRDRYLEDCLSCSAGACQPRQLPEGARQRKFLCRRLYQTPRWVPRTQLRSVDVGYLVTRFRYSVSAQGKATDIEIITLDSDLEQPVVLDLITQAAAKARFEPLYYQGSKVPLLNIVDSYILQP